MKSLSAIAGPIYYFQILLYNVDIFCLQVMLDCWQLDPGERPGFPELEATINQLAGEGSHLLFATYPGFQYQLYAPHLEFMD